MIKIHISPNAIYGIKRVYDAMVGYLPQFGIENVGTPHEADIIVNHGASLITDGSKPLIHIGHGLYWSRQPWGDDAYETNARVIESMCASVAHTVPSEWVGRAVRRGGYFYPEVVYHGVDADEFTPNPNHNGTILFNKARADYVSDPNDMLKLASLMTHRKFVGTVGRKSENVEIIGTVPYEQMKSLVAGSGLYLCTARETFGIGTLEALACGVPVVGWDWGGQSEIIRQGETGYLAHPGNYKELAECVELAFEQRERLSANALADVRERWGWQPRIKQYAEIIKRVYADYYEIKRPKVSIIITTHNLDKYLPDCIGSVTSQSMTDYECLVVDDAQSDETKAVWGGAVKDGDKRFRYLRTPRNLGLVGARNFGFAHAKGRYIRHLDADDMLAPGALAIEAEALDKDPTLHIAYGHLEVIREDGSRVIGKSGEPVRSDWPPEAYNWYHQMSHLNQLPSCVMARREVFERSGGYRERMTRNEDAEFWCRVTSLGFRARKVTQAVTYLHRERHDSKGATEWKDEGKEPDWTAWFPWRQGAADFSQAREIIRKHGDTPRKPHLVPFAAQGKPPRKSWYAHDYAYPVVSVIVTVGPNHERFVLDALDSLQAQTYTDWECVLVNDTGYEWNKDVMGAPWARVVSTGGNKGASVARNEGFKYTRGKYVIWLDADDYWLPWFLERMVSAAENNAGVIYSDFVQMFSEKEFKAFHYMPDFDARTLFKGCSMPGTSILIPRALANKVGWDTEIPGIEDWEFQIALANECACFYHIPEMLFVYRYYSTTKREKDHALRESILEYVKKKWDLNGIIEKRREQMACGCGGKKLPNLKPASTMSASGNFSQKSLQEIESEPSTQMVMLEYIGGQAGTFSLRSKVSRDITYRFGNNDSHRLHSVLLGDAEIFLGMNERGAPIFRMLQGGGVSQANDPTEFIGHPIAA